MSDILKELEPTVKEVNKYSDPDKFVIDKLKKNIQIISDKVTDKYKVSHIPIQFSNKSPSRCGAVYYTHTYKVMGKKLKRNFPDYIIIYEFDIIFNYSGEIVWRLSHELAHHVLNETSNSLAHSNKHSILEDDIGCFIAEKYEKFLDSKYLIKLYNKIKYEKQNSKKTVKEFTNLLKKYPATELNFLNEYLQKMKR